MRSIIRAFLVAVSLTFLLLSSSTAVVTGEELYGDPLGIYPERGSVFTEIHLQVRIDMNFESAYIYWDDLALAERLQYDMTVPYGFDFVFTPPHIHPYSELGTHNITVVLWPRAENYPMPQRVINAAFEIVEYYPPADLFWEWWESLPEDLRQELRGPEGPQGEQGPQGERGPTGERGPQGEPPPPFTILGVVIDEPVLLGLTVVALVLSIGALTLAFLARRSSDR